MVGVVERRQTLPVLANFLLVARDGKLSVTGTDMEVELIGSVEASVSQDGEITVPARKLVDIVRALPDGSSIDFSVADEKATLSAAKSRFTLSTLPASEFPATDAVETLEDIAIKASKAVGGGILGIDMMEDEKEGLVVHEVNNTVEFKGLAKVAKRNIPKAMVEYAISCIRK